MKIICIGRNYTEHISELNNEKPTDPIIFLKPETAILLKKQAFFIPDFSDDVHYEVELLVKINKVGKHIQEKFAHKYYQEIGLGIDFTARSLQKELSGKGLPWEKAKGFDGSAVVGEKWIDKNSIENLNNINFSLVKNDETVQKGNSSLMLWNMDGIISYVSQFFTLKIGDIIFTGTPKGVGKVEANDKLAGYIEDQEIFSINVK